jgi:glutamate N-acetyltransferase / amino-acid N-acetyltransferase
MVRVVRIKCLSAVVIKLYAHLCVGEGTNHVMKLKIKGAPSQNIARDLGRFVLNSNLFKCAVAGNDPNVGRIVAAIGSFLGKQKLSHLQAGIVIRLGGIEIFSENQFRLNPDTEKKLSDYMLDCQLYSPSIVEAERTYPSHFKTVDIDVDFASDIKEEYVFYGSDLTNEYVEINADYRS